MRDGTKTVMIRTGITPRIITDNTPVVSVVVDSTGYEWVTAVIVTGALDDANATFTTLLEAQQSGGGGIIPIPDASLVSQTDGVAPEAAASFTFASDNNVRKIEILPVTGLPEYKLTITPSGNTGNAFIAMAWLLGAPMQGTVVQLAS